MQTLNISVKYFKRQWKNIFPTKPLFLSLETENKFVYKGIELFKSPIKIL